MKIKERFLTTGIGSLPYLNAKEAAAKVFDSFDIPFWVQMPKKTFKENMYVQFAAGLPSLVIDEKQKKIYIDTRKDLSEELGRLYEAYLNEDYGQFGLTRDFAEGLYAFLDAAKEKNPLNVKGQVTGPISSGLSIVDENGKSIIYIEALKDALIKLLEIKIDWQIDKLKEVCQNVIFFIDEPYLTSFGSSFVSLEREDIILMLNTLVRRIQSKGALSGVHCCGNTDWSILVDAGVDIINFDAYSYAEGLALYPQKIKDFLKKGGMLAWGIMPTNEDAGKKTDKELFDKLIIEIKNLEHKGIPRDLVISNSLLTPSCGMGLLPIDLVEIIIKKLSNVSKLAKDIC